MRTWIATCTLALAISWFVSLAAAAEADSPKPRFGIYLPRMDVYTSTADVTRRINEYLRSKPEDIPLAEQPIISEENLVRYDWETHTLELQQSIWFRIREPGVHGVPFVVVADGQPLYVGAFWNLFSSVSTPVPVIMWDPQRKSKTLAPQQGYPGPEFSKGATDPRADERLKKVLSELGKLK